MDPWLHLFVLKIEPLIVVLKELRRTGPGQYTGQDLPLMGKLTASLMSDGTLGASGAGALGPANHSLIPNSYTAMLAICIVIGASTILKRVVGSPAALTATLPLQGNLIILNFYLA